MKKLLILFITTALVLGLSACDSDGTNFVTIEKQSEQNILGNEEEIEDCKKVLDCFIYAMNEKDVMAMFDASAYNRNTFFDVPEGYSYEQIIEEFQKNDTYYTTDSYNIKTTMEMPRERVSELNYSNELKGKAEKGIIFFADIRNTRHFKGGSQSQTALAELEFVKIEDKWYIVES